MTLVLQFALGLLFGIGLIVAGMADPAKVLNFLDIAAIGTTWDPSLAFVMAAGTVVAFLGYRLVLARPGPVFGPTFHLPHKTALDTPLLTGAALFGIGWGLVGLCPGPAFVALGTGSWQALVFVPAMVLGMIGARLLALGQLGLGGKGGVAQG